MFRRSMAVLALVCLGLLSTPLWAASCATTIEATDAMKFSVSNVNVPSSCAKFTVTLHHTGNLGRNVMGHDWVMTTAANEAAVDADGAKAGLDHNYLKPGDHRVLAATPIIGGGQTTSVSFKSSILKAGTKYVFFCSFPGHATLMHGTVTLVK